MWKATVLRLGESPSSSLEQRANLSQTVLAWQPHWKAGTGTPWMAQRAHTDHSDPRCQPGENALSSKEWFGAIFLTRPPARRAGTLQEEAAGTLSLCLLPLQHHGAAQFVQNTTYCSQNASSVWLWARQVQILFPRPHGWGKVVSWMRWRAWKVRRQRAKITVVLTMLCWSRATNGKFPYLP